MTGKLESLTCPTTRQSFAENLSTGTGLRWRALCGKLQVPCGAESNQTSHAS